MTTQQQQQSSTVPNEPKKTTNDLKHTRTLDDLDNDALEGAAGSPPLLLFLCSVRKLTRALFICIFWNKGTNMLAASSVCHTQASHQSSWDLTIVGPAQQAPGL